MGLLDRLRGGRSAPDALTAEIAARLRVLPGVEVAEPLDADRVSVTWAGRAEPHEVDLAELRPRWKQSSGFDRIELVDRFIESLQTGAPAVGGPGGAGLTEPAVPGPGPAAPPPVEPVAGPGWDELGPRLQPRLQPAGGHDALAWPIGGGVDVTVVADGIPLTAEDCAGWEVGQDDVRVAATANLERIDPAPQPIGPGARAWVPTAPAGNQSAWLTSPGPLLAAVGLDEGIAFAPLTSELVVVDPADDDLLRTLLTSTEQIVAEQADPLTAVPFLLTAGSAEPWTPPAGHPLAAAVARLGD